MKSKSPDKFGMRQCQYFLLTIHPIIFVRYRHGVIIYAQDTMNRDGNLMRIPSKIFNNRFLHIMASDGKKKTYKLIKQ